VVKNVKNSFLVERVSFIQIWSFFSQPLLPFFGGVVRKIKKINNQIIVINMDNVKFYSLEEMKACNAPFIEKFKAGTLDGAKDASLFFQAAFGMALVSKAEEDDEDKQEMWENLADQIEEYESIGYFIEIIEGGGNHIMIVDKSDNPLKVGSWEGEYDENHPDFASLKHKIWMLWNPATQLQIMGGNPNTDAQFFSGELKVKGSLKLASMPRQLTYDYFEINGIELD